MFDIFVKTVIAIGTVVLADKIVKKKTGKHIHEHAFNWWSRIRDKVSNWLHENPDFKANRIAYEVLEAMDRTAVRVKRVADTVTLRISAVSGRGRVRITKKDAVFTVCTRKVPREDLLKIFPNLKEKEVLIESIN